MSKKKTNKKKKKAAEDPLDMDDIYDPQLITIARDKLFLKAFEKKAGSLHGEVDFDEFCACLEILNITKYDRDRAKKAFRALDTENEDALEFENFVHAVHGAYPKFDLLWKPLMSKKKYTHFSTIEGPYSEDQLKTILKDKTAEFKDQITALRVCGDMIADPNIKDREAKKLLITLLPGLLAALRSNNPYIVRVACLVLSDVAKAKKANVKTQVAKILNVCWEVYDSKEELAAFSALKLSKVMLKYVPDDAENKVLKTLIQGTNLKDFDAVQRGCFEGIKVYIRKAGNPKAKVKPNKDFWELTKKLISEGLASGDETRKQRCYELLVAYEKANANKAARITNCFNNKQEAEYSAVKGGGKADDAGGDEKEEEEEERQEWQPDVSKRGPRDLSRDYDERKEELGESFDAYDDEGEGYISNDRCRQFIRDLFDVTGTDADIACKGLDTKLDGCITKPRMLKWSLAHSWKKVKKNPYLDKEGIAFGYKSSRKERLEQRVELFEKLKEIEVAEHNYAALYDIDHRMCVLR
eukprot:469741_1